MKTAGRNRRFPAHVLTLCLLAAFFGCRLPTPRTGAVSRLPSQNSGVKVVRYGDLTFTPDQQAVRERVIARTEAGLEGYIGMYLKNHTEVRDTDGRLLKEGTTDMTEALRLGPLFISADDAKEFFPEYADTKESRTLHSNSVHEAASAIIQEVWARALRAPDPRGYNRVLMLAGGVSSGKTTALRRSSVSRQLEQNSQIIYDGTMHNYERSLKRLNQLLTAGKSAVLVYIHTPIEISCRWVVKRAIQDGRLVSSRAVAETHWDSQQAILRIVDVFKNDPRVSFRLFETTVAAQLQEGPIDALRNHLYAADKRFKDKDDFIRYAKKLIRGEMERIKRETGGKSPGPEIESAFRAEDGIY